MSRGIYASLFASLCVLGLTACAGRADGVASNGRDASGSDAGSWSDEAGGWSSSDAGADLDASDAGADLDASDATDAAADGSGIPDDTGGCPVLAFPTGVHIQTYPDQAMTDAYTPIADTGNYPLPTCFLDVDKLDDPTAGVTYPVTVQVGTYFKLSELVSTELPYSHKVLVSPDLIAKLDAYRKNIGKAVILSSGYRSPQHQRDVCMQKCGQPSCPGICAARSRHSWGDAADIPLTPTQTMANAACAAQFHFIYLEGGHLHLDLNPAHKICDVQIL